MFDAQLRTFTEKPLSEIALLISARGVTANQVTIFGFVLGMIVLPALATQSYVLALIIILTNRFLDGLDGAIARIHGPTDLGGYLDIVLDFIFYATVVFGFVLGRGNEGVYGAFLIFSFIGTGSSFLAFAALAAKRGLTTEIHGNKSLYYLGGLTEGGETILVFILICLLPDQFSVIALVFGGMCWLTTLSRIRWAWKILKSP